MGFERKLDILRTRAWRRHKDYVKAKRKRLIDFYDYWWYARPSKNPMDFSEKHGWYNNLHQYSKNKIHCSCPMCSAKTRNKGRHRNHGRGYEPSINYTIADRRKIDRANYFEVDE